MVSRRFVLQSMFGAALMSRSTMLAQDGRERADVVPPSIAALRSMRNQATPISVAERRSRIERARRLMIDARIEALLLTGGTSLTYFTGARWGNSERLMAVVLPARGDACCICPAFEEERVRELLAGGPLGQTAVLVWQEDESPFRRLADALRLPLVVELCQLLAEVHLPHGCYLLPSDSALSADRFSLFHCPSILRR